jgi:hypothetical protein
LDVNVSVHKARAAACGAVLRVDAFLHFRKLSTLSVLYAQTPSGKAVHES